MDSPVDNKKTSNIEDLDQKSSYIDLEPKEFYELMKKDVDSVVVDVSPRFDKGHIPGAINYYIGDGSLDKAIQTLAKDKTYLVYCHVDSASIPGAQKFIDAGFSKVYRLKGNYPEWLSGGYPIEVSLKAVAPYTGSALAERSYLNGQFNHIVVADLQEPATGKFYEGWLVDGKNFFSTGKMQKLGGKFQINYSSKDDRRNYKQIVITEETELQGLDNNPEAHVLEGKFE